MNKKPHLYIGIAVASVVIVIVLIVQYSRWYSYWQQELSSDTPLLYIKSISLDESKARLDLTGVQPVILFPPQNWDKVAAVARQRCLDMGCEKAVMIRGPQMGFSIVGSTIENGRDNTVCEFRFDFHFLNDCSVKLTMFVYSEPLKSHSEKQGIRELARRIGI